MPYRDPDPTDPSMLVGVMLPGAGADGMRAMAAVFADEFARLGHGEREIFALFEDPFYGGAHAALRALGVPAILALIQEAAARWPVVHIVDADADPEPAAREGVEARGFTPRADAHREPQPSGGVEARGFTPRADAHREAQPSGGEIPKES